MHRSDDSLFYPTSDIRHPTSDIPFAPSLPFATFAFKKRNGVQGTPLQAP